MSIPATQRQWLVAGRPVGRALVSSDFELQDAPVARPRSGEVLLKTLYLSFDPAQKSWMEQESGGYKAAVAMGQVMPLFDAIIESSKAGVRKPDPRIYQMMCDLLDVAPDRCVYLDDLGINCKPAAALGMKAIKVIDVDQTLADLSAATGLEFA